MDDLLENADKLQQEATELLNQTPVLVLLGKLGKVIQTGSSTMGLMVYPDIDFSVQTNNPKVQDAIDLTPDIFSKLAATALKIADFRLDEGEPANYYLGTEFLYQGRTWHIDATVSRPGPIVTNPPELADWLKNMTVQQREVILKLKMELYDAKRYVGARSQPPYTFRSSHLYEAVLNGSASTIRELENYFK